MTESDGVRPKPTVTSITVSAKRKVETTRYGNAEVMCAVTVDPDLTCSAGENLDLVWALISDRIDGYIAEFVAETDPKK